MSQESDQSSSSNSSSNLTQFFLGKPDKAEVQRYFERQLRFLSCFPLLQLVLHAFVRFSFVCFVFLLPGSPGSSSSNVVLLFRAARQQVRESSHEIEDSPDLSQSFEANLLQRKQRREETEKRLALEREMNNTTNEQFQRPCAALNDTTFNGQDNTFMQGTEDSFLANEKMCENTLHLNNVSENFFDLTGLEAASPTGHRKPMKKFSGISEETRLDNIEAPSFFFNNTSMMSPKNSPLNAVHANRPSTIMELSESSTSYKTNMTSYQTALTRSENDGSDYKTANDESLSIEEEMVIKMPKIRSFYDTSYISKDSLEESKTLRNDEMTKDSLNSFAGGSSENTGNDSSVVDISLGPKFNDTLEEIEYMLLQNQKLQEQRTPKIIPAASPVTPRMAAGVSPFASQLRLKPNFNAKPALGSASKNSPLMKFSPLAPKSPANNAFKRPMPSATKTAKPPSSKKFTNIESPIARYINNTPVAPQAITPRALHGIGTSPKNFNFRDSESFAKENESANAGAHGSSLPFRAKTKSSAVPQVKLELCCERVQLQFRLVLGVCSKRFQANSRRRQDERTSGELKANRHGAHRSCQDEPDAESLLERHRTVRAELCRHLIDFRRCIVAGC